MEALSEQELYELAKKRVDSKIGFNIHLAIYFIFSSTSIIILLLSGFSWRVLIPVLGWGIGILAHFITLYFSLNLEIYIQKELKGLKK